ncbi:MAG: hypothetical protein ACRDH9_06240 [Actinomycetota bacterium]
MRRIGTVSLLLVLCTSLFQHAALSEETSTLQVDAVTVGSNVTVTGTLALGTDATDATKVGTDGSGDASVARLGYDVGDAYITPNLAGKRLTLSIKVNDGLPVVDGIGPAAGYVWPLAVNGSDNNQWLAAGTYVSGWLPKTEKWFELCSTASGSYTCGTAVTGSMSATEISWTVPFNIAGTASYGSTFEVGASTPGAPGVIPWAVVSGGSTHDVVGEVYGYMIPGKVEVGIAPAGTQESNVNYTSSAGFIPATSKFTVAAPKPAAGSYTVFVRTCFGLLGEEGATCLRTSQPLTV